MDYSSDLKKKSYKDMEEYKCILLTERSQFRKLVSYLIPTIWHPGKGKAMETAERSMIIKGLGGGDMRDEYVEHRGVLGQPHFSV